MIRCYWNSLDRTETKKTYSLTHSSINNIVKTLCVCVWGGGGGGSCMGCLGEASSLPHPPYRRNPAYGKLPNLQIFQLQNALMRVMCSFVCISYAPDVLLSSNDTFQVCIFFLSRQAYLTKRTSIYLYFLHEQFIFSCEVPLSNGISVHRTIPARVELGIPVFPYAIS